MVLLLAPVALAGYRYYKKKQSEAEDEKTTSETTSLSEEEATWDSVDEDLDETGQTNEEVPSSEGGDDAPATSPTEATAVVSSVPKKMERNGPFGKFMTFCENMEKEVQKAQERKRQQALEAAARQRELEASGTSAGDLPAPLNENVSIPQVSQSQSSAPTIALE